MSSIREPNDPENGDAYADNTPLTMLFGDGPKVCILSAFLADPDPEFDYTITEIAEIAGVSRNTVYRHIDDLLELGVIVETRQSGGSTRYKLNKEHSVTKHIGEIEWELMEQLYADESNSPE